MNRKILRLAVPNIISNITIPLVGMADLAIVGLMHSVDMLGGMAIGGAIFNLLYWNFGFLRMGTSGLTAQAFGRRDFGQAQQVLMRALTVASAIGVLILVLQIPIARLTLLYMDGTDSVSAAAAQYFYYRIWAAPATLSLYAFNGWFIGMQNSRTPMWIAIFINVVNIGASLLCAFVLRMGIGGVALGTTIAQWSGVGLAVWCVVRYYSRFFDRRRLLHGVFEAVELGKFFRLNRDIFIRTLCLVAVFTYFTKESSSMGTITLAANTLLLQLFTFFSYFMDGFAYAGEALTGRYTGASNKAMLRRAIGAIFRVGAMVALFFTLLYYTFGSNILLIFSPSSEVLAAAESVMPYVSLVPLLSFAAFLMDGILVGMTRSVVMRNSMIIATVLFFAIYLSFAGLLGTVALWIAFLIYLLARGVFQIAMMGWFGGKWWKRIGL